MINENGSGEAEKNIEKSKPNYLRLVSNKPFRNLIMFAPAIKIILISIFRIVTYLPFPPSPFVF